MDSQFWSAIAWIVAACVLGLAITWIFSGLLKLSRNLFLIPYVVFAGAFLTGFFLFNKIDVAAMLSRNWIWGVVAGILTSLLLVRNVMSQPKSRQSKGPRLAFEIAWPGLVYGLVDGIFLSVMPVAAIWSGTAQLAWASTLPGQVAVGAIGLAASLLISLAYHIGYAEFRGARIKFALIGPGIITLAFLIPGNPLGSIISHPVMHIAAVLRGPETTVQLPPHRAAG